MVSARRLRIWNAKGGIAISIGIGLSSLQELPTRPPEPAADAPIPTERPRLLGWGRAAGTGSRRLEDVSCISCEKKSWETLQMPP